MTARRQQKQDVSIAGTHGKGYLLLRRASIGRPCEVPFLLLLFFGQAKKRSLNDKNYFERIEVTIRREGFANPLF